MTHPMGDHDIDLLRGYASERSETAFNTLVTRHIEFVYNSALRQLGGAAHRAEDVTQAVFVDLARNAPKLLGRSEIIGWLYTSTHHAAAKLKRGEARRQRREQEAQAMNEQSDANDVAWERLGPVLEDAMHELSNEDRSAVLLRYFKGQRYADIGRALGTSSDAARVRTERALDKLRSALARRHVTSTSAALAIALANQPCVAVPAGLASGISAAALAAGAGSAGGTATLLFMSYKTASAVLVAIVTTGIAGYQIRQNHQVRVENSALQREQTVLRASLREAQDRAASLAVVPAPMRVVQTPALPAAAPLLGKIEPMQMGGGRLFLSAGPTSAEKIRAGKIQNLDRIYNEFYTQLGWAEEQRQKFRDAMIGREDTITPLWSKAVTAARQQNPNLDRAGQFELLEATFELVEQEQLADIQRLFGQSEAGAFTRFREMVPARLISTQLSESLRESDASLSTSQAAELVSILARNSLNPLGKPDLLAMNVDATMEQASGILSAAQLVELRRVAEREKAQAEADRVRNTMPAAELKALVEKASSAGLLQPQTTQRAP